MMENKISRLIASLISLIIGIGLILTLQPILLCFGMVILVLTIILASDKSNEELNY